MKKTVLISGSNGEVARQLTLLLKDTCSLRYLTRKKNRENEFEWNIETQTIEDGALEGVDSIIHLAGAGIADERWTDERKKVILSSRIDSARLLLNTLTEKKYTIDSFISASAIGFYGSVTSEKIYTEEDKKGEGFLSDVCSRWEKAADDFSQVASRIVKIRIGVVLSRSKNGALEKIKKPITYYAGAYLGSGKQYMPWVHIEDLCEIFKYSMENGNIRGVYNAVAPQVTTNKELTQVLAQSLNKPILLPFVPSFLIRLLFGEAAEMLLNGSRVSSQKLTDSGFIFKYPELKLAIQNLVK